MIEGMHLKPHTNCPITIIIIFLVTFQNPSTNQFYPYGKKSHQRPHWNAFWGIDLGGAVHYPKNESFCVIASNKVTLHRFLDILQMRKIGSRESKGPALHHRVLTVVYNSIIL